MTKGDDVTGLTLDTGALLALERGDGRVRALLRRASEVGTALDVPAGVEDRAVSRRRSPAAVARSRPGVEEMLTTDPSAS